MKYTRITLCMLLTAPAHTLSSKTAHNTCSQATAQATLEALKAVRPAADIMSILKADVRFSSFVAAVEKAGLAPLFADRKYYTLFAPTNDACALMGQAWDSLLAVGHEEQLATLIKNHIVHYRYPLKKLVTHSYLKTLSGNKVTVAKDENGVLLNGSIRLTTTDVKARCGIIHVVDAVIVPPVGPQAPVQDLPAVVEPQEATPEVVAQN